MARLLPPRVTPDVPASPVPAVTPATLDRPRFQLASGGGRRRGDGDPVPAGLPARELWLAVYLPGFMLESLRTGAVASSRAAEPLEDVHAVSGHHDVAPVAVVDLAHGGKVVCDVDARAAAAGIVPGMALNSALALAPALQVLSRDPRREQALLEAVARAAGGFTPRVSLEPPDAVLLEVRGSLRLFGGARRLCEHLRSQLRLHGVEPSLALTPAPLASLWFARAGVELVLRLPGSLPARLASLPLACTRWPVRVLQLLATMGVRTVGGCLRLPRDGFARRFEPRLRLELDRATARVPDPRMAFVTTGRHAAGLDFEPEIEDGERLQRALEPLIDELCAFLQARGAATESLELRLRHRESAATRLCLRFAEPVSEAARITDLLRERLARTPLPGPVRGARLRSGSLVEASVAAGELFGRDHRRATAVPQLVERLCARLGVGAVHGLSLVPEHRPEAAQRSGDIHRFSTSTAEPLRRSVKNGECPRFPVRPAWLLPEPQPLEGGEQPRYEGALEIEEGPERIESGWWDGRDVRRDYYVARNPGGVRLWIFRERSAAGRWFLHGVFG
jgi:protein ImuB